MKEFEQKAYKAFQLFGRQMPLVTAGSLEHFNSCTIGWGWISSGHCQQL